MVDLIADYPSVLLEKALHLPHGLFCLRRHVGRGVKITTQYSGIDAPGEGARLICNALTKARLRTETSSPPLVLASHCDKGKEQQKVLVALARETPGVSPCVFRDLESFLNREVSDAILQPKHRPPASHPKECEAYHVAVSQRLKDHARAAFPVDGTAWCLVHERHCSCRAHRSMTDPVSSSKSQSALIMSIAGTPCIAWSGVGARQGSAHWSELPFQIWLAQRRQLALEGAEDFFVSENVKFFPAEQKIKEELAPTHQVVIVRFSPKDPSASTILHAVRVVASCCQIALRESALGL